MGDFRILVVEDDPSVTKLVRSVLELEHYKVTEADSAHKARSLLRKVAPDLLILDRTLPDQDGLKLCEEVRSTLETKALPILFLTARKSPAEKVLGLRGGGDDYLAKPFEPDELLARVDALLRRSKTFSDKPGVLAVGPVKINVENRKASLKGKDLELTNKEFELLRTFLERQDRVLTRQFLLSHVWGYDADIDLTTKAVDMALVGLRKKLGAFAERIEAVKGYGYRFRSDAT